LYYFIMDQSRGGKDKKRVLKFLFGDEAGNPKFLTDLSFIEVLAHILLSVKAHFQVPFLNHVDLLFIHFVFFALFLKDYNVAIHSHCLVYEAIR